MIFVICTGFDYVSKQKARGLLESGPTYTYIYDTVRFQYVENRGAFWGLGSEMSEQTRFYIFIVFTSALTIGLFVYSLVLLNKDKFQSILFMLIASGSCGNLYDRIFNNGGVIDFINVGIGSFRTATFNFADVLIMFSTLILLYLSFTNREVKNNSES